MKLRTYVADHHGIVWILPAILITTGPEEFKHRRKIVDVAFHWITFGFGLCIEWGRKS